MEKEILNEIECRIIKNTILKNESMFLELGEIKKRTKKTLGRPKNEYDLNQQQFHLLLMLLGNSETTKKIKFDYVKENGKNEQ